MEKKISKTTKIILILTVILICIAIYFTITKIYTSKNQTPVAENTTAQNQLAENQTQEEPISNEQLYTVEDYPKVDASTATQPLVKAFMKNFTKTEIDTTKLEYTKTHSAYVKLINDEVDLIVVTEPSEDELNLARKKGVELEVIPVVREGFVFYVNSKNKVENLTTEQIQKIYTGEITNWKELGVQDEKIIPYQRPVNSGSQTGMQSLVMKDKKLMEAPKENLAETMSDIINLVSMYKNGQNAIGYSYYYYATTMFQTIDKEVASNIKLLGIDGVKPNNETIQKSTYPFTTSYYIVINKADDKNSKSRILANHMLSARGQKVAEETGYVPVK